MRGGKREGAGRPKGSLNETHNPRAHRQLRAYADEWAAIKEFVKVVRSLGAKKALELIKAP